MNKNFQHAITKPNQVHKTKPNNIIFGLHFKQTTTHQPNHPTIKIELFVWGREEKEPDSQIEPKEETFFPNGTFSNLKLWDDWFCFLSRLYLIKSACSISLFSKMLKKMEVWTWIFKCRFIEFHVDFKKNKVGFRLYEENDIRKYTLFLKRRWLRFPARRRRSVEPAATAPVFIYSPEKMKLMLHVLHSQKT